MPLFGTFGPDFPEACAAPEQANCSLMASLSPEARKRWMAHLLAVLAFFLIATAYFNPVLGGKILVQGDTFKYVAMSHEIQQHRAQYGEEPLWTNSTFGGMPAYQISMKTPGNLFVFFRKIVPRPISFCFVAMLGAYVLLLSFGMNRWVAVGGAIAYGLSTYFISFIEAGHNSKSDAVAYMPFVIAGLNYLFKGRYGIGVLLTVIAMTLQITVNHLQITYYMFILIGIWGIAEGIQAFRQGTVLRYVKALALFGLISALALGANATRILTTMEYAPWTIRGASELSIPAGQSGAETPKHNTSGLDRDYTFDWSYGVGETLTLLFPNYAGGASQHNFAAEENSRSVEMLRRMMSSGRSEQEVQSLAQLASKYWGNMSFTGGPIYLGAIVIFLFFTGCLSAPKRYQWWLIAATVVSIFLAWGKNFSAFNYFLFDHFPMYNKFRTVMMAMVIADLTIVVLAGFGLQYLLFGNESPSTKRRILLYSGGAVLLLALIPLSAGLTFTPASFREAGILAENPDLAGYFDAIHQDRVSMIRLDAFRSLAFIGVAFGLLWIAAANSVKPVYAMLGISALILVDLLSIDLQYLNSDNFQDKGFYEASLRQSIPVIPDEDPHFRVLNVNIRLDQDGMTPFAYHAVSGYHGAKSRRYQDLISENQYSFPLPILNMLNTRYVIGRNNKIQRNPAALGNAWTVDSLIWAGSADEEMAATKIFDPARAAIVREEDRSVVGELAASLTGASGTNQPGQIELTAYKANELTYRVNNPNPVFAVFSEMYYRGNEDWIAYLDGQPADHIRVNYILRGMPLPAGQHELVFRFDPPSFHTGVKLSLASSVLLWLLAAGGLYLGWKNREGEVNAS